MNKLRILNNGLAINKISKSFGNKQVVKDVSLSIKKGEIVGLLGPNGAGKTTIFYIVVTIIYHPPGKSVIPFLSNLTTFAGLLLMLYAFLQ